MLDELFGFLEKITANPRVQTFDEASTKQAIILPLLNMLGWNTYNIDEVTPEYCVENKRVDFSLRIEDRNEVFLEVKKPSEDLENHQKQLLDYSFHQGVELAVLTNGTAWWFFLPLMKATWKARKFYAIDVNEQELHDVSSRFADLLSKDNIRSGKALKLAESLYKGTLRKKKIEKALPEAWNRMVSEPDPLLIDLLSETTEKLTGYKPDEKETKEMLKIYAHQVSINLNFEKPIVSKPEAPTRVKELKKTADYFEVIGPGKEKRIQDNILDRRDLWEQFLEKKELRVLDFKKLSAFKPKAVAGFSKYITENGIADRAGDSFRLRENAIGPIKSLLEKGFTKPIIQTGYFKTLDQKKAKHIKIHILDRKSLWVKFLEKKVMSIQDFKQLSHFKSRSISGFFHFLTANGIATRVGYTFELNTDVIPEITKILEKGNLY
jgi:hypothetical protein